MASSVYADGYTVFIDGVRISKILDDGIPIPEVEDEEVDDTNQDSGNWEESISGRKKGGTVTLKCTYDSDNQGQIDLENAWAENPKENHVFTVILPRNIRTWTYDGWVKTFKTPIIDKKLGIEATIRVTGNVELSTTASALTTPFFAVKDATSGTAISSIVPAPSAVEGVRVVYCPAATTGVKIVPTSTTGTITVNGGTVASGAESATITLGGQGSITEAIIKVSETGKSTTVYRLLLARAST